MSQKEIIRSKNYVESILIPLVPITFAVIGSYLWKPYGIYELLLVCSIILMFFLSKKFTDKIIIDETTIQIFYYKYFILWNIKIDIQNLKVKEEDRLGNRGYKYKVLIFIKNEKEVYTLNMKDGFEEQDLFTIKQFIS